MDNPAEKNTGLNFIQHMIEEDMKSGRTIGSIHTRFPPEPNGYLHIGHAKSICLNFGLAEQYQGLCNLRFDDTNPSKEETEYVDSIMEDIKWLGFDWQDRLFFASNYFEDLYRFAVVLIKKGKAYVCDLSAEEIRSYRGTLTEPGKLSPYRERSVEENLDLFAKMRSGVFEDGSKTLRAKIDMNSPNVNMRDPVIYRILRAHHHRTGDTWCLYPMYDYAHPLSDALEKITHSICTLEFEDHRPLYDWFIEQTEVPWKPRQIEFARLNITRTYLSKRILRALVEGGWVDGWDDPRMPTLSGLRRRGYTPEAIKTFCDRIGVAKSNSTVEKEMLEHCIREDLNAHALRVMAVLKPLKVVITNYPENQVEWLETENNPEDPNAGTRKIPFSRGVYIEETDFMEEPPKKFFRLSPGNEVRLKSAYIIRCDEVIKNPITGNITELHCSYDPNSKSNQDTSGKKVKGTLHWVSAPHAIQGEVRLYQDLLLDAPVSTDEEEEEPKRAFSIQEMIRPDSMEILKVCYLEPSLSEAVPGAKYQFLRQGYFCLDSKHTAKEKPIYHQIVTLKDTWLKLEKSGKSNL
ncbi:MAG: glutamine--tRNA ligase/YqeY domain fusion protein [Caldisericia bacterium]|nr:glutamine--tRNA ligase/YqeY domain fusion protein [Caldisericia bacterium]